MDLAVLALAKSHTDSQSIPRVGENVIVHDVALEDGVAETPISTHSLEVSKTYAVTFDAAKYNVVCKYVEMDEGNARVLGNPSLLDMGEDTGESYLVAEMYIANESVYLLLVVDSLGGAHCTVAETIHKIDPKYLPDGVVKPKTINLPDYGIDLYTILVQMLSEGKNCVSKSVDHVADAYFWNDVTDAGDNLLFTIDGRTAFVPTVIDTNNDMAFFVGFNVGLLVNETLYVHGSVYLKYTGVHTSLLVINATSVTPEI